MASRQASGTTTVGAVIDDYLGLSAIMNRDALWRLSGDSLLGRRTGSPPGRHVHSVGNLPHVRYIHAERR